MEKSLAVVIKDSGVNDQSGIVIQSSFDVFLKQVETWKAVVKSIVVTSSSQKKEMKQARTTRLTLKDIRVAAKKRTAELKAEALKYNSAVQEAYNFIEDEIKPLEEYLFAQEKFAEIEAAELKIKLREERNAEMEQYGSFAPHGIDYASLTEEEYIDMKGGVEFLIAEKAEADRIAEEERLEKERKVAIRASRLEVLRPFWNFMDDAEKQADYAEISDDEFLEFVRRLTYAKDAYEAEQEQLRVENERLKTEAEENERLLAIERKAAKDALEEERKLARIALEKAEQEKKELADREKKGIEEEKARRLATMDDVKQSPLPDLEINKDNSAYLGSNIYVVFNGTDYELKHGSTSNHSLIIMPDTVIIKLAEFSMKIIANG